MVFCFTASCWANGIYKLPAAIDYVWLILFGNWIQLFWPTEYHQLFYVVGAVWVIQIIWSHIWLRYFRFGPLEWLWRSLTYWKKQPFKKNNSSSETMSMS